MPGKFYYWSLIAIATSLFPSTEPLQAEVRFTQPPQATQNGNQVEIAFSLTQRTDVEVSVLNKEGKIIRHLAAGMVDSESNAPRISAGLQQKFRWDGKTDASLPAKGGPFSIRVRAGMGTKYDGILGENKHHFAAFWGMATDGQGNVFVLGSSTGNKGADGTRYIQVFNREGKYQRTIMPMPASLSPEQAKPFHVLVDEQGRIAPRNHRGTWPVLYPKIGNQLSLAPRIVKDGTLWLCDGKNMAQLNSDGSGKGDSFSRSILPKDLKIPAAVNRYFMSWKSHLASSPDGKTIYLCGLHQTKPFQKKPLLFPVGRIYKTATEDGTMEPLADIKSSSGDPAKLGSLTTDKSGNLLVCDRTSGRIVVLDPAGKQLGEIKVDSPHRVACDRKSGAVYVLTAKSAGAYRAVKRLIKFSGWKNPEQQASHTLPTSGKSAVLAIDESSSPLVIWIGIDRSKAGDAYKLAERAHLFRLEERGSEFVETEHDIKFRHLPRGVVTRLAVHPENDVVLCRGEYAHAAAYDGLSGKQLPTPFKDCVDMNVGRDGFFYVQTGYGWDGPLAKFDRDLKPVEVDSARKPTNTVLPRVFGRYGNGFGVAGFATDARGRLVVAQQLDQQTIAGDCVVTFDSQGKPEDPGRMKNHPRFKHGLWPSALIGPIASPIGGVAIDEQGYTYLAVRGLPLDHKPPTGYEKDTAYNWVVGSVLKFKPAGGSVIALGGPLARPPRKATPIPEGAEGIEIIKRAGYPRGPMFAENAVAAYPGIGSMSGGFGVGCRCRQPMFHLDGWGRLYLPNAVTYSVEVLDNAGNRIDKFGSYGNIDSRGTDSESLVRTPEIPLGWPEAVGVSDKAIYIADVLNRRIVRVKKTWQAEATIPVR